MANKYANLIGANKIKDDYTKINIGFDKVETDINTTKASVTAVNTRVDTIITTPLDSEAATQEIVDARISAVKEKTFGSLDARLEETENDVLSHLADYASLIDNPTMHRNIFRGKNLGTVLTAEQKTNIQNGTFKGLFLGDYWVIGGRNWRIVDFNYWYNCGDTAFTNNHLVIMPDTTLYTAQMNATNITTGGYVGSEMYTANLENAKTIVNAAFGSAVLTHREYLTNAVTSGYPSAGAWFDSDVELPNEIMMYGSLVFTPAGDGTIVVNRHTISKTQLALFSVVPKFVNIRASYWLRDVVSASYFARVSRIGFTTYNYAASNSLGVRPVFAIG